MKKLLIAAAALFAMGTAASAYETPLGPQPQLTAPFAAKYPAGTPVAAIVADNEVKQQIDNPHDNHMAERYCYFIRTDTGACVVEGSANGGGGGDAGSK